ncbi:metallophosphoesterase family protein [Roseinatronobacter alkalisoli]|uniref:DNA repair exonuclease n=1 Tax=Roseinatronobacter alkalisoli TaxID=3028235 RepID=A0ABT5T4B7_9RHOB|nr:DNA repair exonuclease [Roseinatronobacter sp. HJB301]MDD7969844.1 DNA repair exonuclease [Roseinatronobacter sp. HJB301]
MGFRFIHTADLHLDSPLRSLALRDPDLAGLIAGATRTALRNIIDLCLSEQVDALLISGDLYDGSQTSMKTARFLSAELARLNDAGIRAFIIRGNHDAESRITRELTLPPCVHLFEGRPGVEMIDKGPLRIALHGLSFREPKAPESLLPKYRPPVADAINIGLMHTSLNGAPGHDPYAPCALSDLQASGFAYWALGHIHKRMVHEGAACVVMPGIPQGRDIGEADGGTVTLVTVDDDGTLHLAERCVALASFCPVRVDVTGLDQWHDLLGAIRTGLEQTQRRAPHLVARLRLTGATPLAQRLLRDRDLALAEAQELARGLGQTWVEKLVLDLGNKTSVSGELAQLAALIDDEFRQSDSFLAALDDMRATLQAALPPEPALRAGFDQLDPAVIDEGLAQVLARLGDTR